MKRGEHHSALSGNLEEGLDWLDFSDVLGEGGSGLVVGGGCRARKVVVCGVKGVIGSVLDRLIEADCRAFLRYSSRRSL